MQCLVGEEDGIVNVLEYNPYRYIYVYKNVFSIFEYLSICAVGFCIALYIFHSCEAARRAWFDARSL